MKVILFDVDDTLYDQMEPFRRAYDTLFGTRFALDLGALFEARGRRGNEVFELSQSGAMSMRDMYIYRVQRAFDDLGFGVSDEAALQFQKLYEENQKKIELSETVTAMLDYCKSQGLQTGIITNGGSAHQWGKIQRLGLTRWIPEEYIFVSGDCGAAKPEPEFFRCIEERLGLPAQRLCIVGDSYEHDIVGAKQAGWEAVWLNKRGARPARSTVWPDYVVKSEEELYDLIRRCYCSDST